MRSRYKERNRTRDQSSSATRTVLATNGELGDVRTRSTWHRRTLAILTATTLFDSLTVWATQAAIATPASAATVKASPYFAGAVANPGLMHTGGAGTGKFYTESGKASLIVPTVTCPPSQTTSYVLFQYLEGAPGEDGLPAIYLNCGSGTLSAYMFAFAQGQGNPIGGCASVPVAAGDSISFSEQDSIHWINNGQIPVGTIEVSAYDSTDGEYSECTNSTASMPSGPVYTGICQGLHNTGPVPPNAPPPPVPDLGCGSTKVCAFTPFSFSGVQADNKPIWQWPTHEYDMYRYRQAGSTLEPIEQVQTQKVKKALDFTFLHR